MSQVPERDARDRVWSINDPAQMLGKLGWEMSTLFDVLKSTDVRLAAYFALNGCITAWHMVDWVVAYIDSAARWDDARRVFGCTGAYRLRRTLQENPLVKACGQVANATMHVFLDREGSKAPGYHAIVGGTQMTYDGERHYLALATPEGEEEAVWHLYRTYEWWANHLRDLGFDIQPDAPIGLGRRMVRPDGGAKLD